MVDDDVLRRDRREAVAAEIQDAFGKAWRVGREEQVGPVVHDQLTQIGDAEQPVHLEDALQIGIQLARDQFQHVLRHARINGQTNSAPAAATLQRRFIAAHQVLRLFLKLHIGVADQAEQAGLGGHEAGEKSVEEQADQILEHHETDRRVLRLPVARAVPARILRRQADEALHLRRQRQQRPHRAAIFLPHQLQHHAKREVDDEGEGMRGIDRERRQHRKDAVGEIAFEPGPVGKRQCLRPADGDAGVFEQRAQFAPGGLLAFDQALCLGVDRGQRTRGREAIGGELGHTGAFLPDQPRDAHGIELVEVGSGDRDEAQPFQQGVARIRRLLQHAGVEG